MILGKPWLERFNPHIDWRKNKLTFTHDQQAISIQSVRSSKSPKVQVISAIQAKRALSNSQTCSQTNYVKRLTIYWTVGTSSRVGHLTEHRFAYRRPTRPAPGGQGILKDRFTVWLSSGASPFRRCREDGVPHALWSLRIQSLALRSMQCAGNLHDRQALEILRLHQLYGKLSKCAFYQEKVEFPRKRPRYPSVLGNLQLLQTIRPELRRGIGAFNSVTDPELEFLVTTDASDFAVGAVLSQDNGDGTGFHPVAFESRKMSPGGTSIQSPNRSPIPTIPPNATPLDPATSAMVGDLPRVRFRHRIPPR